MILDFINFGKLKQVNTGLKQYKNSKTVTMEVKPFKALRFDAEIVGNVGNCIAPPYDVINTSLQQKLYEKSGYNIVRITKGQTPPSDDADNNRYTMAAGYLKDWMEKGALKQDPAETIYACVQDFDLADKQLQRLGFIALAKLEEFGPPGHIRPHEKTMDKPRIDRLNLRRETAADFGLVFMIYEDKEKIADKIIEKATGQKPLIDFHDEQGVRHRLFPITEKEDINAITEMMSNKNCIIADGHHRYETALIYSKETANPAAEYQMVALANTYHEGLVILATHRLVGNLENFRLEKLLDGLKENFEITKHPFKSDDTKDQAKQKMLAQMKTEHDKGAFGIYGGKNAFYVAILKEKRVMNAVNPDASAAWNQLDVSILHKLILEKLLGIGDEQLASGSNVEYIKDTNNAIDESITMVDKGQKQAAFFLNPVKMEQLKTVTDAGEKMPQKSTYFFPKMYSGMVINKL